MSAPRPTASDTDTRSARFRRRSRRELERRLTEIDSSGATPPPPADLLARLKQDIPQRFERAAGTGSGAGSRFSPRALAWAASMGVALIAGLLAVRGLDPDLTLAPEAASEDARLDATRPLPPETREKKDPSVIGEEGRPHVAAARDLPGDPGTAVGRNTPMSPPAPTLSAQFQSTSAPVPPLSVPPADAEVTITTTSESPLVDAGVRRESTAVIVSPAELQKIPTSQDRRAVIPAAPQVLNDRARVGDQEAGQQSLRVGPGSAPAAGQRSRPRSTPPGGEAWTGSAAFIAPPAPVPAPGVPNAAPYDDVFFESAGTNPFVDAREDRLSTFGLDVDTASYTIARRYLEDGHLPPTAAIRVEEFVNAQPYTRLDRRAPSRGVWSWPWSERQAGGRGNEDFALGIEAAPTPFVSSPEADLYRVVRLSLEARTIPERERLPVVLTFVVDTSGSMAREDRLGLVRRSLTLLVDELRPRDRVGLVAYDDRARLLLEPTTDHDLVRRSIDRLVPGGATNAEDGLALGYEVAGRAFDPGATNRVLLASDGVANVGHTGPEAILETIGRQARRGILLTTVGFGMGNYNDVLMERLADRGDGLYAYVDSLDEANRVFRQQLDPSQELVAKDAKVQVEFDPAVVERWRLLGYENRDIADRDFRNDRVDAGEVESGHAVTALYEVKLAAQPRLDRGEALTLRLRYRQPRPPRAGFEPAGEREERAEGLERPEPDRYDEEGRVVETIVAISARDLVRAPSLERASFDLRLATVAAQFAEKLKGSYWAKEDSWVRLEQAAQALAREARRDDERSNEAFLRIEELSTLISRARRLAERGAGEFE